MKLGYTVTKMYENIQKAFGESAVSCATFQFHGLFTSGKKSVEDKERRGRLATKMFENIKQVEQVLKKDCEVSCGIIVESTGILNTIVRHILRDDLKKKLRSCFVQRTSTTEQ